MDVSKTFLMVFKSTYKRTPFFLFLFFINIFNCLSQSYFFGEGPVNWELRKPFEMPPEVEKYSGSDLVILSDLTEVFFYSSTNEKLTRSIKYKINTQKGLEELKHYRMPESFDYAMDNEFHKQGRRSRIKIPYPKRLFCKSICCPKIFSYALGKCYRKGSV